jgi:hypothetical protein
MIDGSISIEKWSDAHPELDVGSVVSSPTDAGAAARERLAARALRKTKWFLKWTFLTTMLLAIAVVTGSGWWVYEHRHQGYDIVYRNCKWKLGDSELTGTRTYSYPYQEYLGYRLIQRDGVEEKTVVTVNGGGLTVIGLKDTDFWVNNVKEGERGPVTLKDANNYVFQQGKNWAAAKYSEFCK